MLKLCIWIDQGDVQGFHATGQVHFAEIIGHVDAIRFDNDRLQVSRGEFDARLFIAAKLSFSHNLQLRRCQSHDSLFRLTGIGAFHLLVGFQCFLQLAQSIF